MAIHIITGRPGTGKTAFLTHKIQDFLDQGRPVWANVGYKINDPRVKYFRKVSELVDLKEGVIAIDEAQIYFNSRNWESLDERLQYKLQQHRHHGLDIWGTVQNIKRLDIVMRELVSNYYEASFFNLGFLKFLIVREYAVEDAEKVTKRQMFGFSFAWLNKKLRDLYDTHGDVELLDEQKDSIIEKRFKRCPECGHDKLIGS